MKKILKITLCFSVITILTLMTIFAKNSKCYHKDEISLLNKTWSLNLPYTDNVEILLDNTGGFPQDGEKIIKLTYPIDETLEMKNVIELNRSNINFLLKIVEENFSFNTNDKIINLEKNFISLNQLIKNNNISCCLIKKNDLDLLILLFDVEKNEVYLLSRKC